MKRIKKDLDRYLNKVSNAGKSLLCVAPKCLIDTGIGIKDNINRENIWI